MCFDGVIKARKADIDLLDSRNRSVDAKARPMSAAISEWLHRYGVARFNDLNRTLQRDGLTWALGSVNTGQWIAKARDPEVESIERLYAELYLIIDKFGLAQVDTAGEAMSRDLSHSWILAPQIRAQWNAQVENKVVLLIKETETKVRQSITQTITDALLEIPRPSAREVGRRIARTWFGTPERAPTGDPRVGLRGHAIEQKYTADWRRKQEELDGDRESIFSFTRAQTIARNEMANADAFAIKEAVTQSGIEEVTWKSYPNDGRSGKRNHWMMNDHPPITVAAMNGDDPLQWFELPSGIRAPYPKWPGLPAGESILCRCSLGPARRLRQ